jgi:hypothetical protein
MVKPATHRLPKAFTGDPSPRTLSPRPTSRKTCPSSQHFCSSQVSKSWNRVSRSLSREERSVTCTPESFRQKAGPLGVKASPHSLFSSAQILISPKTGCHLTSVRRSFRASSLAKTPITGWTRLADQGPEYKLEGLATGATVPLWRPIQFGL